MPMTYPQRRYSHVHWLRLGGSSAVRPANS